jgi:hypothetical protein
MSVWADNGPIFVWKEGELIVQLDGDCCFINWGDESNMSYSVGPIPEDENEGVEFWKNQKRFAVGETKTKSSLRRPLIRIAGRRTVMRIPVHLFKDTIWSAQVKNGKPTITGLDN